MYYISYHKITSLCDDKPFVFQEETVDRVCDIHFHTIKNKKVHLNMAIKLQNNYTNSNNLISMWIVEIYFLICHLIYCVSLFCQYAILTTISNIYIFSGGMQACPAKRIGPGWNLGCSDGETDPPQVGPGWISRISRTQTWENLAT